jgi:hypothetical protein
MLGTWLTGPIPPGLIYVVLTTVVSIVVSALTRLALCGLALYVTVKVLSDADTTDRSDKVRQHRMAILLAILTVLQKTDGAMLRSLVRMISRPQTDMPQCSRSATQVSNDKPNKKAKPKKRCVR